MEIPNFLESQIRDGKVVIVLGAGASRNAKDQRGNNPPTAKELGSLLSDKYLGGKHKDLPLNQIGEYAISESDLITVQEYLREIFETYDPSHAHKLMCSFVWWGIATTNYDRLIERAYETVAQPLQIPIPFVENGDRVEDKRRDPRHVTLLKLHGCITRTTNHNVPLILTTEQYIEFRKGRSRIFDQLSGWGYERTIVFIGHSLQDPDIRALLLELTTIGEARPRYYAVAKDVDEIQKRFWDAKRVTLLHGTFEDLMTSLDATIPSGFRGLAQIKPTTSFPISERFAVKDATLSQSCIQFLQNDAEYVNAVTATETVKPKDFYKGLNLGWSAIEQNLDVRRELADTIMSDHFLIEENEHLNGLEVILIKAHAGAGKSILMRRLAWDAAHDYEYLCLYVRPNGIMSVAAIQELINLCKTRIFLFVDNAADRVREIQSLAKNIGPEGKRLTVIISERINEWNMSCSGISTLVATEFELGYLSHKEIDGLIGLLEHHHALGTLEHADQEGRRLAFAGRAGRQLLVALHEATLGRSFEDIIEDEYSHIVPAEAQRIYLTISVLNRLNVPVRAGIIARIHGVPFEDFKKRLFSPLEHIVLAEYDSIVRDYMYRTRHPHIAEIVFERILNKLEERYDLYIKCLRELNVDYTTDSKAFWQMVRGRTVLDLFHSHELAKLVYEAARERVGDDPHLLHQMAIYEMIRPSGNINESLNMLTQAERLAPYDPTIKHSIAELRLRLVDSARTPLEKEKLMREASEICVALKASNPANTYSYHTLVKIALKRIEESLAIDTAASEHQLFEELVKDVERNLAEGLQKFPGDPYLLAEEAKLGDILSDSARVISSLEKAFNANPRNAFFASRLANVYSRQGNTTRAREVLEKALDANPGERKLHYAFAKLLMTLDKNSGEQLAYHLKRAFTPGDTNYDAQLLYGRQLFINGDETGYKELFRQIGTARVGPEIRNKLLYPLEKTYRGRVDRKEATYCFIARDGQNDWIYAHRDSIDENIWKQLVVGARVMFRIAFSLRGPNAQYVQIENQEVKL